jgi:bifunctional non-homologous end joining protein LigD
VTWEEVERTLKKKDANSLVFEAKQTVARMEKLGDLFAPVLELKQRLPDLKAVANTASVVDKPISITGEADEPAEDRRRARKKSAKLAGTGKSGRKI